MSARLQFVHLRRQTQAEAEPCAPGPGTLPQERISADVFAIALQDQRYLVYAPLPRSAFVANAPMANLLARLAAGESPAECGADESLASLLRALGMLGGTARAPDERIFAGEPKPTSVTLFLTTACNLRCTYCYADAGTTPLKAMTLPIAMQGIDFVAHNALQAPERRFEVAFHGGGEPTANWHVLTGAFDHARQRADELGLAFSAAAATNGVLRDEQIDWIVEHLSGVSLSFDGLPQVHDSKRITAIGTGSSQRVMHTLERFDRCAFPYGIRVTVTAENIAHLPDSVEFICARFAPQRIQIEPAYQLGRWSAAPSAETQDFIDAYRKARLRARAHGREISFSAARSDTLSSHFCGVTQDSFALSPDGNVSACYEVFAEDRPHAEMFFYGKADPDGAGYRFDHARLDRLRRQTVRDKAFCQACFAKWNCAGDCLHRSVSTHGSTEFHGSDRCHITRELTKDQLLERIADSGGVFWSEGINAEATAAAPVPGGKEALR